MRVPGSTAAGEDLCFQREGQTYPWVQTRLRLRSGHTGPTGNDISLVCLLDSKAVNLAR